MVRNLLLCLALSTSAAIAVSWHDLPYDLQQKITALPLVRDVKISYEKGWPCIAVIGINTSGQKNAFVALRYIGSGSIFRWTPFTAVPFYQENDTFGMIYEDDKVVVIQSNSTINHANPIGYHVEFDRATATAILHQIGSFRMPTEQLDNCLTFTNP